MYRGTTPSIPITLEGVNLTEAKVILTLYDEQKKIGYDFVSGEDFIVTYAGDDSATYLTLTQEQTLAIGTGMVTIQARWVFPDGVAGASQKCAIQMQNILKDGVISYDS